MKLAMWLFAGMGSLGLFDWVIAGIIAENDPSNRFASSAAGSGWLFISLLFMAIGLLLAWLPGCGAPSKKT